MYFPFSTLILHVIRSEVSYEIVKSIVMIKSMFVYQSYFLHVSTGNHGLLGNVLLELVVGPVLQSIVDVLPNISIFISKL